MGRWRMNPLAVLMVICVAVGVYKHWPTGKSAVVALAAEETPGNFVKMPAVQGMTASQVFVISDPHCPRPSGERARQLVQALKSKGIDVVHTGRLEMVPPAPGSVDLDEVNTTLRGEVPIVFVNGRAKANPTLREVLAQYKPAG